MSFLWIGIAVFHLISLSFMGIVILRLFAYVRRYKLTENRHTLLFGFIAIEHIVALYVIAMVVFTFGSLALIQFISGK
jgi:uncharacterized membrane protein YjdF